MKIADHIRRIERFRLATEEATSRMETEHGKAIQVLLRRWIVAAQSPDGRYPNDYMIPHESVRIEWEAFSYTIYASWRQRDDIIKIQVPLEAITDDGATMKEFESRRTIHKAEVDRQKREEQESKEREQLRLLQSKYAGAQ